jgi:Ca-activated chloride channel family protein
MAKLPQAAAAISLELRNQYLLGYLPSNAAHDGKWRKIKVRLTPLAAAKPLQVYCKRGYQGPGK